MGTFVSGRQSNLVGTIATAAFRSDGEFNTTVNAKRVGALEGFDHKGFEMAENSGISWTDNTFNPIMGCTKVSPACKFCYAERDMDHRYGRVQWGPMGTRVMTSPANWFKPLKWNKEAGAKGIRLRVFCASLADVFEDWTGMIQDHHGNQLFVGCDGNLSTEPVGKAADYGDMRKRLFKLIDETPNLDWLLLTKRPENIERMWNCACCHDDGRHAFNVRYRHNVWLGTSVENQEYADKRIPELLKCRDLAPVLFLSCEPFLGHVDLPLCFHSSDDPNQFDHSECAPIVDWVITGGESGNEARPSHPEWFRSLRDQCAAAGVPFHFKQWGEYVPGDHDCVTFGDEMKTVLPWHEPQYGNDITPMVRVGVTRAGRLLDGVLHDAFPEVV